MNKLIMKKAVVIAAGLIALSTAVTAGPRYQYHIERIYYSDAALTQFAGEYSFTCTGSVYGTGEQTPYYFDLVKEKCHF